MYSSHNSNTPQPQLVTIGAHMWALTCQVEHDALMIGALYARLTDAGEADLADAALARGRTLGIVDGATAGLGTPRRLF